MRFPILLEEIIKMYSGLFRSRQEEEFSLDKIVFVVRDATGSPEGIKAGMLKLIGTDEEVIYENFRLLLENLEVYEAMTAPVNRLQISVRMLE